MYKKYSLTIPDKGFEDFDELLRKVENAEKIFNDTLVAGKLY